MVFELGHNVKEFYRQRYVYISSHNEYNGHFFLETNVAISNTNVLQMRGRRS